MGSIYKRGRIWWLQYYKGGKCYRESSKSRKESGARKLLRKREAEIDSGRLPGVVFDKVKFDDLAEDFIRDRRINGKSSPEKHLKHLRPHFEGFSVPSITSDKINRYIDDRLHQGAANATVNKELSALKRLLNLGAKQTPPKVDRVPYIAMLEENNVRQGFFEHDDFLRLRDVLPDHLRGAVVFAYKTGWRRAEILGLTWSNVDLHQGIVRLEPGTTKNKDARTVYLDTELQSIFRDLWGARAIGCPFVFHKGGRKIADFRWQWNRACRDLGLGYGYATRPTYRLKWQDKLPPGPILHDFRRSAIRNMVRSGVSEGVAMKISGHRTRSVFERYNIVSDSDLRRAAALVQNYTENQRPVDTKISTIG